MTKKDYELIAQSVRRSVRVEEWTNKNRVKREAKLQMAKLIAGDLTASLANQDPMFKKDKFYADCGF
jgi:hypothetical protein